MANKKAYLVELTITTRVIVNEENSITEEENSAIMAAIEKTRDNYEEYLSFDFVSNVTPDEDMPYGEGLGEE